MNRWTIHAGAGAALLALAVAACGGAGHSGGTGPAAPQPAASTPAGNGVTAMRADQATQAALTGLTSARSVHVAGTFTADGRSERFDMRFAGNSAADGSFTMNGAPIQVVNCDGAMYLKPARTAGPPWATRRARLA